MSCGCLLTGPWLYRGLLAELRKDRTSVEGINILPSHMQHTWKAIEAWAPADMLVAAQGLLAELRKDETSVEGTITADLRKAEQFLEGVEAKYRLPKWMPFKDFLFKDFRFPWDKAPQAPQLPQIPGLPSQI